MPLKQKKCRAPYVQHQPLGAAGLKLQLVRAPAKAELCKASWVRQPEVLGTQEPPQSNQRAGHRVKEDYSQALRLNALSSLGFA